MMRSGKMAVLMTAGLAALASSSVQAQEARRQLVTLAAGEQASLFGSAYQASGETVALASASSDLVTIAVIKGALTLGKVRAEAGEALVTPLDGARTQRFGFDAARLAATLPPQWQSEANSALTQIAAKQKRAKFWGLIEPAGLNAAAPAGAPLETVRQSYLGHYVIIDLRRKALGKPEALATLTVKRFAEALAGGDTQTVAALIDPKPFTDTGAAASDWQAARLAFAQKLTSDAALRSAMAAPEGSSGTYAIQLVARDRVLFVSAVEPKS